MTGDWRDRAACGPATARLFDPIDIEDRRGDDYGAARLAQARAICAGCPVRVECLDDGIDDHASGIRGGELLDHGTPIGKPRGPGRPRKDARTQHVTGPVSTGTAIALDFIAQHSRVGAELAALEQERICVAAAAAAHRASQRRAYDRGYQRAYRLLRNCRRHDRILAVRRAYPACAA